jgi:hypothetical protein
MKEEYLVDILKWTEERSKEDFTLFLKHLINLLTVNRFRFSENPEPVNT